MKKVTRKTFLKLTGGAGLGIIFSAAGNAVSKFIPYVNPPEHSLPGEWVHYATVCRECPAGCGMHLWNRDRRVTKAEGNPGHPVNKGKLCARGQSSLQGLYDPDRLTEVINNNRAKSPKAGTWDEAVSKIGEKLGKPGSRVIVISDLQTGTLSGIIDSFASKFSRGIPAVYYEPFNYEALKSANRITFGKNIIPKYNFDQADNIISFGADILETWISPVAYAYLFNKMHSYSKGGIGKFTFVGPRMSLTAGNADTFIKTSPEGMAAVAFRMLSKIIRNGLAKNNISGYLPFINGNLEETESEVPEEKIDQLVSEFVNSKNGIAVAGSHIPDSALSINTAVAANLLNYSQDRLGKVIDYSKPHSLTKTMSRPELDEILSQISKNDIVIIHNANIAYSYKNAIGQLEKAGLIVYIGTMKDETALLSDWILPSSYYLETWGDYEPEAGIHGLLQPVMAPLYGTLSAGDIFLLLSEAAGNPMPKINAAKENNNFYDRLRGTWREIYSGKAKKQDFEGFWRESLRNGGTWNLRQNNAFKPNLQFNKIPDLLKAKENRNEIQLWLWPSIMLFDGRTSNRTWLQEVPEPSSYIGWNSWIDIHPDLSKKLNISRGDVIQIERGNFTVEAPANITKKIQENVVSIAFGQGHTAMGKTAKNRGANAFNLLLNVQAKIKITKTGKSKGIPYLAATEDQHRRDILKRIKLSKLRKMKEGDAEKLILPLPEGYDRNRDVYPPHEHKDHRWAMVIDLQSCIGCGACSVACYAENNIPVVGEKEVLRGREQAWLKVIPYKSEDREKLGWIPVLCQHCDSAPCEPVCPVFAAVHNEEGLNAQVYNRCIGTRYCSNNCPYKVRKFNWFDHEWEKPLNIQLNPEVTVRSRGVMEKCTFCIQRIKNAEHHARVEGRKIKDGDIVPACAQTCPVNAIIFGDLLDNNSEVSKQTRHNPRRYHVLEELNTKPAITYMKKIDNDERT